MSGFTQGSGLRGPPNPAEPSHMQVYVRLDVCVGIYFLIFSFSFVCLHFHILIFPFVCLHFHILTFSLVLSYLRFHMLIFSYFRRYGGMMYEKIISSHHAPLIQG